MFVSQGCTAHAGNSLAMTNVGSGKVKGRTQVLKFNLRQTGVGKMLQRESNIYKQHWTIEGVIFHVVQDKGRVWMRVGGGEEWDGI